MKFNPDEQTSYPYGWAEVYTLITNERARQQDKHGGMQHDLIHKGREWKVFITGRVQWLLNWQAIRNEYVGSKTFLESQADIEKELIIELAAIGFACADVVDELKTQMRLNGL